EGSQSALINQANQTLESNTIQDISPALIEPAPVVRSDPQTRVAPVIQNVPRERAPVVSPRSNEGYRLSANASQVASASTKAKGIALLSMGPKIRVEAKGDGAVVIGKDAFYEIDVINEGTVAANEVFVRVNVPSWVELVQQHPSNGAVRLQTDPNGGTQLVWAIPGLQGRATERLELSLKPTTSRNFELGLDWTFTPNRVQATVQVQEPKLEIQLSGIRELRFGDKSTLLVAVANPGTGAAENVELSMTIGGVVETMSIPVLLAGATKEIEIPLVADRAGTIDVVAEVKANGGLSANSRTQVIVRRPQLNVSAVGPGVKFSGSQAAYRVTVSNSGDAPAKNIQAAVRLPVGAKYLTGLTGAQIAKNGIAWTIGELTPGAERVFTIHCELNTAGQNQLDVLAHDGGKLQATCNVTTEVQSIADLKLTVNDPKGPVPVGESVVYEIEIENRGSKAAFGVDVVSLFSAGIDPIQVAGGRAEISADGQVKFSSIERIDPGQTLTLRITAEATAGGNHVFRANVQCSNPDTNLVSEDTTRFFGDSTLGPATPKLTPSLDSSPSPTPAIR
ncbi:MAG: putative membrane protein, partial [Pirellulaceae bacterium]